MNNRDWCEEQRAGDFALLGEIDQVREIDVCCPERASVGHVCASRRVVEVGVKLGFIDANGGPAEEYFNSYGRALPLDS
ncbi:hypothetical protein [Arthrobacter sp. YC-RL1]|uniref:hypothetical protein n=1 Tax=Arthrobacter sp. YC-RL1 TaxID=1652545 RepID=UPI00128D061C|nr:hypothetical protein [Arthrobacter sp. YC-RL1]